MKFDRPLISRRLYAVALIFSMIATAASAHAREVPFCLYHDFEPFYTDSDNTNPSQGLSVDFASLLSAKSAGRYKFVPQLMPRLRLDKALLENGECVVPWVIKAWFQPAIRDKVRWFDGFMEDALVLVSPTGQPVTYSGIEGLAGKQVGFVRGWRFGEGLDELIDQGVVKRRDASSPRENIRLVAAGRIDAAMVHKSFFKYVMGNYQEGSKIVSVGRNHAEFVRAAFYAGTDADLANFLQEAFDSIKNDPLWTALVSKYKL